MYTEWRMSGDVKLPWRPRIELTGRTKFSLAPGKGGRIVDYYEQWNLPATEVLLQLLRPKPRYGIELEPGLNSIILPELKDTLISKFQKTFLTDLNYELLEDFESLLIKLQFCNNRGNLKKNFFSTLVDEKYRSFYKVSILVSKG